jgi:uncharacterized protein (DUF4415 family)
MKLETTTYNPLNFFQNDEELAAYLSDAEKDDDPEMIVIAQNHVQQARGKNKKPTKEPVVIRYDAEILAAFRATGKGWQTRMNNALKEWLNQHPDLSRV